MKKYIFLMAPIFLLGVDYSAVVDDGMAYGKDILSKQTSNFDANVIQPVTTGTEMNSLDGNQNFTAQMSCSDNAKTAKFLTVSYSGSAQVTISLNVDYDFDELTDFNVAYANVSGVCGNGIVMCNGGWDEAHCKYYQWQYNPGAKSVETVEVTGDLVNSCYCTNDACANTAVSQKREILSTLLSSISQSIANKDPKYILTKTDNDGTIATGYAQSIEDCTQAHMGSQVGVTSQELTNNANAEIGYLSANGDDESYGFMTKQQDNIVNSPVAADASVYANDLGSRDAATQSSMNLDQDNMSGTYITETGTKDIQLADLGITPERKLYCKVKVWGEKSIVYTDSTISTEQKEDDKKYYMDIRECDNNTCLYDNSKEELIEDCQEDTNNFQEAVGQLTAINEASKDMVCSSN